MTLLVKSDNSRKKRLRLVKCPVCDADLSGATKNSQHFANEHVPEDFGLTPLGEINPEFAPRGVDVDHEREKLIAADGGDSA